MASTRTRTEGDHVRNYVDGAWELPEYDEQQAVTNPATGERLATVLHSNSAAVDNAVAAARDAFAEWHARPVEERIQPLFEFKRLLEEHQEEVARTLVREHGKTLGEARGELRRGIENVEVACGVPTMMQAGTLPNAAPGIDESAVRQPLGVFVGITPFNFPGMIPLWFLPYAVATGNAFLLKPSEHDPLTPQYLFELLDEAGFPDGVVQLVNGDRHTVEALLDHDGVAGVSFVGSTPVARHVYERAAATGKRIQAQGGAKNHVVVTETADLGFAAEQTVSSAFACSGERCLANDVGLVAESVHDEFLELVVEHAATQTVGDGLDPATDISPLISPDHERAVRDLVRTGIDEGADLVYDGREVAVDESGEGGEDNGDEVGTEDGNFLGPCIFDGITPEMTIARKEIFGPVFGVMAVADLDEAIDVLNRSRFGNAASLFTARGSDARRFKHEAEAGNLAVNAGTAAPMAFFHFGGRKASFFGDLHAQGEDTIRFFTDKTIYIERWPDA
jgi:malonate-semialdehyde dehydrogenase (acetylating)/methylmalonate-semialdehyde dehydrogenase